MVQGALTAGLGGLREKRLDGVVLDWEDTFGF
jgi:hypothetical protein